MAVRSDKGEEDSGKDPGGHREAPAAAETVHQTQSHPAFAFHLAALDRPTLAEADAQLEDFHKLLRDQQHNLHHPGDRKLPLRRSHKVHGADER